MNVRRRRLSVLVTASLMFAGLSVVGAPAALAHHPEISVSTWCDPATGGPMVQVTARSWSMVPEEYGNHDDVRIQMRLFKGGDISNPDDWTGWVHEVGAGAFHPDSPVYRTFTRTLDSSSVIDPAFKDGGTVGSLVGRTVQLRLHIINQLPSGKAGWYNDAGTVNQDANSGNGDPRAYSAAFVLEGGCQSTPVLVGVTGSCATNPDGTASGSLSVSIDPDSGATVTVAGNDYTVSTGNIPVPPGDYPWSAVAAVGHTLEGTDAGSATVEDCSEELPAASISVDCETVTNTSDPGVFIDILDGDEEPVVLGLESDGSADLTPGEYSWVAYILVEQEEGGEVAVPIDSGEFTIEECGTTTTTSTTTSTTSTTTPPTTVGLLPVTVSARCPGTGATQPVVSVDPEGGATVELTDEGDGLWSWVATAGDGYEVVAGAEGSFDTAPCADVLGTVVTTSTSIPAVSASTLPFTGFELDQTLWLALTTAGLGLILLLVSRKEEDQESSGSSWGE